MTWLVLRYWYGYHRSKFFKWEIRKYRFEQKVGASRYRRRVARLYYKYEYHRFWFNHYCKLLESYGHLIECIHFGPGENTIQMDTCPYREDWCKHCEGKIHLGEGRWKHYLSKYSGHEPEPKLLHWPHNL